MANIKTIRFVERKDIDLIKYNKLVRQSKDVTIYCYDWYLDATADNWGLLVLGDYKAVLPIPYTIKYGLKIIYQPYFTRELTIFSEENNNSYNLTDFISALPTTFKKVDFNFFKNEKIKGFEALETVHQELDLTPSYETIYSNYSKNTKRLIKKAIKQKCLLNQTEDVNRFIDFFKKNTGHQVNYTTSHYENLNKLMLTALKNKQGLLYEVLIENRTVAFAFYLLQDHRITYLKGSATEEGKKAGAMFLMMNKVIEDNSNQPITFDFGGSKIESIAQFYNKFGAKNRNYFSYRKNELSWIVKKGKNIRDLLKN